MKIKKCRICNSTNLSKLFSLGKLSYTGKFSKKLRHNIAKDFLNLIMCQKCFLVQLDRNFNPNFLYANNYGYRTGINKTMTNHVKTVTKEAIKITNIKKKDYVLDIASNDGTLLNFYSKNLITVGIDPLINKYRKYYKNINYKISDFFSYKKLNQQRLNKGFKIITALSVFYDLKNPNAFIKDIKKLLHKDGVFILEHADLLSIINNNLFDTICHEHLEYYSSKVIIDLMNKHDLRVFDYRLNDINGGSMRYFICHKNSNFVSKKQKIDFIISKERKVGLTKNVTFKNFFKKINKIKINTNNFLNNVPKYKTIHGYGASTKGNVLLQYFGINNKLIPFIAEKNSQKFNNFTPGTKIKIISEDNSRNLKPDYYFVLPWHFKKEILSREKKIRSKGTKFIFPLPKFEVI